MDAVVCFVLALLVFVTGIEKSCRLRKSKNKRGRILNSFNVLFSSVFVSSIILFFPIYGELFEGEPLQYLKTFLLSVHNTIRLFIVDGEFTIIMDYVSSISGWIYTAYSVLAAVLFVVAPLLTFGVVLSFFKNISAYRMYLFGYFRDAYIFSELNEKSLVLAGSLKKNNPRRMIVFTDVFESNEESSYELIERAREINAVCFKKDIQIVNFKVHSKKKNLFFFAIGGDETENMEQSLKLIAAYGKLDNTHLYSFSTRVDGELLLTTVEKGKMKVRRVNDVRSLINRILYEDGGEIFSNAIRNENGVGEISAVIVGMGRYGINMLKSLAWFCQMDGYSITIDAFDRDMTAYDKLYVQCPDLLSEKYNGVSVDGEAQYKINIHSGMDIDTKKFADEIGSLQKATYVLVALGSDEDNIRAAVYLRMLFERNGANPVIHAIVHSSSESDALKNLKNFKGQSYRIRFIGDLESTYAEEVILDSELERDALERHMKWGSEEEFWNYEYNYRSSIAAALHMKAKAVCGIPGSGKEEGELTKEELAAIEALEHRRWNAYMRSEGYIYSGSPEEAARNDLGKMHHNLVSFSGLTEADKRKDSRVGMK